MTEDVVTDEMRYEGLAIIEEIVTLTEEVAKGDGSLINRIGPAACVEVGQRAGVMAQLLPIGIEAETGETRDALIALNDRLNAAMEQIKKNMESFTK